MANLYKPEVTKIDPQTKQKIKTKTKKWYGRYRDENGIEHRIPLAENKNTAQQMLAELLLQVERIKCGLVSPIEFEMKKNINEHLADYEKHLKARNNSIRHIHDVIAKIKRFINDCQWKNPLQIKMTDVENFLVDLREKYGNSIETCNHYLRALKAFCNWMYINKRHVENPILSLKVTNSRTDRRHDRRALSDAELQLLINAAESGPPVEGISGVDRAIMYLVASYTGFRKGEIGSMTIESFVFNSDNNKQEITVEACYSKRRRHDVIPLHPSITKKIKHWLKEKKPKQNEILFPISKRAGSVERDTAKMIQFDLNAARTFWIAESKNKTEENKRKTSEFLLYCNNKGKFADFHCLRHTFVTNLGRHKVPPQIAQALARHSDINLTLKIYNHIEQDEHINAINTLPTWEE